MAMASRQGPHQSLEDSTGAKNAPVSYSRTASKSNIFDLNKSNSNSEDQLQLKIAKLEAELAKVKLSALQDEMKRGPLGSNNTSTTATTPLVACVSEPKKKNATGKQGFGVLFGGSKKEKMERNVSNSYQ